jgi:hypothetical protein
VGTLPEIRQYACAQSRKSELPVWRFENDRQHWTYRKTTDAGWPIKGELCVNLGEAGAAMVSPLTFWKAEAAGKLSIDAAFETTAKELKIFVEPFTDQERRDWLCWGSKEKRPDKKWIGPVLLSIVGDGKYKTYEADLKGIPGYNGAMIRLKFILPTDSGVMRVRTVALGTVKN